MVGLIVLLVSGMRTCFELCALLRCLMDDDDGS